MWGKCYCEDPKVKKEREGFLQLLVEGGNEKSGSFIDNKHIVYKGEEEQNNLAI